MAKQRHHDDEDDFDPSILQDGASTVSRFA